MKRKAEMNYCQLNSITISKGIEEENSNVAIMLMAIQFQQKNSPGDMQWYVLFFFIEKKNIR